MFDFFKSAATEDWDSATIRLNPAVHRRILYFLNEAISPSDLEYKKSLFIHDHEGIPIQGQGDEQHGISRRRILDHEVAKKIIQFRNREYPLGFRHLKELLPSGLLDSEVLASLFHHLGESFLGEWSNFPQPIPPRRPEDLDSPGQTHQNHEGIVHAALLHTGKILFLTADETTLLWNPEDVTPACFEYPRNQPHHSSEGYSQLCSHHVFLSDGKLLTVGGGGYEHNPVARWGYKFDPILETWSRTSNPMSESRWYPTAVALGNRRVLVACGHGSGEMDIYNEVTDSFVHVELDAKAFRSLYPGLHLLPDQFIFYSRTGWGTPEAEIIPPDQNDRDTGGDQSAYFTLTSSNSGFWSNIASAPPSIADRTKGMSVMLYSNTLPYVRIFVFGGADPLTNNTYEVIDATSLSAISSWSAPIPFPDGQHRSLCSAVLLPDGNVFISGGIKDSKSPCAIFNPGRNEWLSAAELPSERDYHSASLLLPNGKIMMAGWHNSTIEIYSPPYLFQGQRPTINNAPSFVRYGQPFNIETDEAESIGKVVLVRPMAVTHQTDTEQRVIELEFFYNRAYPNHQLILKAPDGINPHALAPEGYYMLFILNREGVPSIAKWIKLVSVNQLIVPDHTPIAVHGRHDDHMELWVVDEFGDVRGNWWNGEWHEWYTLFNANIKFPRRGHLSVLGRHRDHMELFGVGEDGQLHGIWWDGDWRDWYTLGAPLIPGLPLGTLALSPGTPLAVSSRFEDHMEIWVVGADHQVYAIWWDGTNWRDWYVIPGVLFRVGTSLAVHCRNDDHMEIWGIDENRTLHGNWWNGSWQGWYPLPTPPNRFSLIPGGNIAVLGKNDDHMEIWSIGGDDRLHGIWWDGNWHEWYTLDGPFSFPPGAPLAVNSRNDDYIDIWVVGDDNRLHGIWWNGSWEPWYTIDQMPIARGTQIAALSRNDDHMEVWCIAPDNPNIIMQGVHGTWWDGSWRQFYRVG